jgi:hypothetical protein
MDIMNSFCWFGELQIFLQLAFLQSKVLQSNAPDDGQMSEVMAEYSSLEAQINLQILDFFKLVQ